MTDLTAKNETAKTVDGPELEGEELVKFTVKMMIDELVPLIVQKLAKQGHISGVLTATNQAGEHELIPDDLPPKHRLH